MPASLPAIGSILSGSYNGIWYITTLIQKLLSKSKKVAESEIDELDVDEPEVEPAAQTEVIKHPKWQSVILGLLSIGSFVAGFLRFLPGASIVLSVLESRRRTHDADLAKAEYKAVSEPYEDQLTYITRLKKEYPVQLKKIEQLKTDYLVYLKALPANPQAGELEKFETEKLQKIEEIELEELRIKEQRKILIWEQIKLEELREKTEEPRKNMEEARTTSLWGKLNIGFAVVTTLLAPYSIYASIGFGLGLMAAEKVWTKENRKNIVDSIKNAPKNAKIIFKQAVSAIKNALETIKTFCKDLFANKTGHVQVIEVVPVAIRDNTVTANNSSVSEVTSSQATISRRLSNGLSNEANYSPPRVEDYAPSSRVTRATSRVTNEDVNEARKIVATINKDKKGLGRITKPQGTANVTGASQTTFAKKRVSATSAPTLPENNRHRGFSKTIAPAA